MACFLGGQGGVGVGVGSARGERGRMIFEKKTAKRAGGRKSLGNAGRGP